MTLYVHNEQKINNNMTGVYRKPQNILKLKNRSPRDVLGQVLNKYQPQNMEHNFSTPEHVNPTIKLYFYSKNLELLTSLKQPRPK